jgi:hypothetical protein
MAYVYRHIRLDKNEPFYIGIGADDTYNRAFSITKRSNRNNHWYSIVKKYGCSVDIIMDDLSWGDACKKEVEFIELYGRIDLGTGVLTNMTNGGEGRLVHNNCQSPLFNTWNNIKKQCFNPKNPKYHLYGGKGIYMDYEWVNDFNKFEKWAFDNGWIKGSIIGRHDKNLGYSILNTKVYNDRKSSYNNTSKHTIIYCKGEHLSITDISNKYSIPYGLLVSRLHDKWDIEKILDTPTNRNRRNKLIKNTKEYNGNICSK